MAKPCKLWRGARNSDGYPVMRVGAVLVLVTRAALSAALGRPLKPGMCACHTCDHPGCVEPSHLWEGTRRENAQDASRKGRLKRRAA